MQQVAQPAFFLRLAELAEGEEDAKQRAVLEQLAIQVCNFALLAKTLQYVGIIKRVLPYTKNLVLKTSEISR